jgi:hypothetical protein
MANARDVFLSVLDHYCSGARQAEWQQSINAFGVLFLGAGLQAYIAHRHFTRSSLPLAAILVLLGLYGIVMAFKYHEIYCLQMIRVEMVHEKLGALESEAQVLKLEEAADRQQSRRFPEMCRLRPYSLYRWLHVCVMLGGIASLVLVIHRW